MKKFDIFQFFVQNLDCAHSLRLKRFKRVYTMFGKSGKILMSITVNVLCKNRGNNVCSVYECRAAYTIRYRSWASCSKHRKPYDIVKTPFR